MSLVNVLGVGGLALFVYGALVVLPWWAAGGEFSFAQAHVPLMAGIAFTAVAFGLACMATA